MEQAAVWVVWFCTVMRRLLPICALVAVLSQLATASAHLLHHHDHDHDHEHDGAPSVAQPCAVCVLATAPTDLDTREVAVVATGERVESVPVVSRRAIPRSLPAARARGPPA